MYKYKSLLPTMYLSVLNQFNHSSSTFFNLRGVVRGVAGVAGATPIIQVLFHKTSQALKPLSPQALKPSSSQALNPSNHQALKP